MRPVETFRRCRDEAIPDCASFESMPYHIRDLAAEVFAEIEKIPDSQVLQDKFAELLGQIALAWYPRVH